VNSRGFKTEEGWLEESFWGTETENAKEEIKGRLSVSSFKSTSSLRECVAELEG